jgi:hypothetical protein
VFPLLFGAVFAHWGRPPVCLALFLALLTLALACRTAFGGSLFLLGRAPVDDRRSGAIGQYVTGDLVLPGEPVSKIAHSAYLRLQLLANAVIAASRVGSYPWVGGLADTENYNSPSKRRLPGIATLASFLPF